MAGTSDDTKKASHERGADRKSAEERKHENRVEGGKKAAETTGHDKLSEAGRKGAEARTHESRVEGGKKAAETIGHDKLSEAGRKGGEHSHSGKSSSSSSQNNHGSK